MNEDLEFDHDIEISTGVENDSADALVSHYESLSNNRERERIKDRERRSRFRERESPTHRAARLNKMKEWHRQRLLAETEEEKRLRLQADREKYRSRVRLRALVVPDLFEAAFSYNPSTDYSALSLISIGEMNRICRFCGAKCFKGESAGFCCSKGKVRLDPIEQPPEPILSLFSGDYADSRCFLKYIRRYNCCFQMTSFGVQGRIFEDNFMPTFRIQGQIHHRIGSLLPNEGSEHTYLQIYFVGDKEAQIDARCNLFRDIRREIVSVLQEFFDQNNNLVRLFRTALERMPSSEHGIMLRGDLVPTGEHRGRFNTPAVEEVAIVMIEGRRNRRDIVIQKRTNEFYRISEIHRLYDPLQYPIIFWRGCDTFHIFMNQINPSTGMATDKRLTGQDYYCHQLMIREDSQNFIFKCGALLSQFVVDMYAKIEAQRLVFIRMNQDTLRADQYIHLRDAISSDGDIANLGQRVILPSSHIGSPRHMHEYAQDAMAYVRLHGRPDLFITFTCNPLWVDITKFLMPNQRATERHDLIARVFRQKLLKLIDVVIKQKIFGPTKCYMYSIEWQKRGLPHSHILVWLQNRIRPERMDDIISAEIPDPHVDPILFGIVTKHMVHGPCGLSNPRCPCMTKNLCSKKFPRAFIYETRTEVDGYPLYRRRKPEEGGHIFVIPSGPLSGFEIDNRWIVPYSPILSKMFNAHLNVEYCNSVKSIKYICKYVHKGGDMAILQLGSVDMNDEVSIYELGRYISSNEAFWRIYSFPIHDRYPSVVHLSVHLENGQRIYFRPDNARSVAMNPPKTTLTGFFTLCQTDPFARTLLYADVPRYYTWDRTRRRFLKRKVGSTVEGFDGMSADTIGRVYTVHPSTGECFYLRMLLNKVRGPTSFEDLRSVDGQVCETYRQACHLRGLLENDSHWELTLQEAAADRSPAHLRSLFCVILTSCNPSNPSILWEKFKRDLSEDILHRVRNENQQIDLDFTDSIFNESLILIEDHCLRISGKSLSHLGLPSPNRSVTDPRNSEILRETSYNVDELERFVSSHLPSLVEDQRVAFDTINNAIESKQGEIFFLDAPGGTGKTFLINLILAFFRSRGEIIIAVASSGIASTLLAGGRTAHSAFKLPLDMRKDDEPVCNITRNSAKGELLQRCIAIIWDECTMSHKKSLEALDRSLRDLRHNNDLMGGVTVVLAGDFRQTLPVIPRSTPADELDACLKKSSLWRYVKKLQLKTNMRVHLHGDLNADYFSAQLLSIGNGTFPTLPGTSIIKFPNDFCQSVRNTDELVDFVFPNLANCISNADWLCERAILAPLNETVDKLNSLIQDKLIDRVPRTYISIDRMVASEEDVHYPTEFLNSLNPTGFPPHELTLKIGSPIMLLRNLDPPKLCNGTRLRVKSMLNNTIQATILSGTHKGEDIFIPRIPLIPNDLAFNFKRLQFPIRLAFAMTINKSQGQSLKVVGIDLLKSCFSHGQLYVACSRVGNPSNMFVLAEERQTKNIVYPQALV